MRNPGTILLLLAACSGTPGPSHTVPAPVGEGTQPAEGSGAAAGKEAKGAEAKGAGAAGAAEAKAGAAEAKAGAAGAGAAQPDVPAGAAAARDAELAARAAGFFDAFTNGEPVLSPDGRRLVFVSNRDGIPQLYAADPARPEAPATRLVTTAQRVTDPVFTRDGKAVLFRSDTGADESWSIFRVGLDGKDLIELTPGERLSRDAFLIPEGAPDRMYFSARKMAESRSTVYVGSTAKADPPRAIYTDEQPTFVVDVAADGKAALLLRYPSRSENYLLRLDTTTGAAAPLFPAAGQKLSIFGSALSPDGKRVYVATDLGAEQAVILALDARTGQELARHAIAPATAQVAGLTVARRGGRLAVTLIVGDHSELRLLDGARLAPAGRAELPPGQGQASDFSADGARVLAQWSTPSAPTEIYAIDARTGKAAPLRREARPTLAALPAIAASSAVIPAFDGGQIPANVYVPAGEAGKPHPVLVVYHGGPAGVSMVRWSPGTAFFLSLGYAVVEPNVRGSSGYGRAFEAADNGPRRLDAFKDIETSARWVAAQPWADKDRLVVFGGSYGGYTTLIALSRWPEIWRAGVDLFGVANLRTFMATTSGVIRQLFLLEFGDPDKDAALLDSLSPLRDVGKIVDPTFVYAGANDPRVPRSESDQIVRALRGRGIPTEYMVADNEGHSLSRRENQLAFYARCARFLEQHLR